VLSVKADLKYETAITKTVFLIFSVPI
jgi:hypothetical protein